MAKPWSRVLALCSLALASFFVARKAFELPPLEPRTRSSAYIDTNNTQLGRAIAPRAAAHPGLSGIHPLPRALDAFAVRALLARRAERSIDAQYYIWHGDLTGSLLFEELRAAADRGVRVRLLLDDNGSSGLDATLAFLDAHPLVEVRLFNPFVVRGPRFIGYITDFARLNRRMHNKSFTVDNQATVIGGRNIGDAYFGAGDGSLFVDLDVLAVGPVVRDASRDFDRYWASASAYPASRIIPAADPDPSAAIAARASLVERDPAARQYMEATRTLPLVASLLEGRLPLEWAPVTMVSDPPAKGLGLAGEDDLLFSKLLIILGEPARSLDLVSGYFVPAKNGVRAFTRMAARGVKVTVLTNALEATDVPIVYAGYAKRREPLLRAGVRLYEMHAQAGAPVSRRDQYGVSGSGTSVAGTASALHAKTLMLDHERVFIGSFNFDPRSANLNTELGFVIYSPDLAKRMSVTLNRRASTAAYEVHLSNDGQLYWLERRDGHVVRHNTEPGTTLWQRAVVSILAQLPIEWLL